MDMIFFNSIEESSFLNIHIGQSLFLIFPNFLDFLCFYGLPIKPFVTSLSLFSLLAPAPSWHQQHPWCESVICKQKKISGVTTDSFYFGYHININVCDAAYNFTSFMIVGNNFGSKVLSLKVLFIRILQNFDTI